MRCCEYTNADVKVKCFVCTSSHTQKCIYYDTIPAELKAFIDLWCLAGRSHGNCRKIHGKAISVDLRFIE